ncbi:MAG: VWA domain-containing protein [Deltaproteobacteria bacterium]|nr:VWA domain-containing protein [Deltaproteobacteria bacterium]
MEENRPQSLTALLKRRWPLLVLVAGVGVVACAVILALQQRTPPTRSASLEARLELAAGDVRLARGGGGAPVVSGAAILADSRLTTGKGARALARLADGSALFLRDETEIALRSDAVALERGEIWIDAPPSERRGMVYEAGPGTVTADDAGLSVKRGGNDLMVYVARGMATVTTKGGRVEVHAGEQATAAGDAVPTLAPVAYWVDWTGGMGDHRPVSYAAGSGAGRIYGVDLSRPGTPPRPLEVSRQAVRAVLRDGLAETEVDQTFFNPGQSAVEGWYWFTVPEDASVTGFELETNGTLVAGELIERQDAEREYREGVSSGHQPALLEWVDARTYRARIFPINAGATRRVVLRYIQLLPLAGGTLSYLYPLQSDDPVRIGEFSLVVDLGEAGTRMKLTTLAEARIEDNGQRVTMRRSGYTPRADFLLEAHLAGKPAPLRVARMAAGEDTADYIMARYAPDLDWNSAVSHTAEVALVVDTSAAGDEAARQLQLASAEAILRALSADDRFALIALDVRPTVLFPEKELAPATETEIAKALEKLADHAPGGATDLAALFEVALGRLHKAEQPALIYVGDGLATSGEISREQLAERLRRALTTSRARFFTVAVGDAADRSLLNELARVGGGRGYRIDSAEQSTDRALALAAAIKTPTLTDFDLDLGAGLDDVFVSASAKVSRGDEVVVLARTHHELPRQATVKGRLAGREFSQQLPIQADQTIVGAFVPRLWAAEKIRRTLGRAADPDEERGRIVQIGVEYGLMTPYTSFIALDSEASYQRQGIPRRRSPLRGVKLSALGPRGESRLLEDLYGIAAAATGLGCTRAYEPAKESRQTASQAPGQPAPALADTDGRSAAEGSARKASTGRRRAQTVERDEAAAARPAPTVAAFADDKSVGMDSEAAVAGKENPALAKTTALEACSDVSSRPLAQRLLLWKKRFKTARTPADLLERYRLARSGCEIPDWRSESAFLSALAAQIKNEAAAALLLDALKSTPQTQRYLAQLVLRRSVDERVGDAVERALFGQQVNWLEIDRRLTETADADKRIELVKAAMAKAPDDPNGVVRLVRLLAEANRLEEAVLVGRRLHDQGLMTPLIARQLGDVLARHGLRDEAVRTYSEIVEFDPHSTPSRRLLGDVFLGRGWYADAYRQFVTLTEMNPNDPLDQLRLAAAAAGGGRVDEALRIERKVAESEGKPGPDDPRQWARLVSAARIATMLAKPPATPGTDAKELADSLGRKLKQLGLFRGPSTWVVLTWEALGTDVALGAEKAGVATAVAESVDANPVGVAAAALAPNDVGQLQLVARLRGAALDGALPIKKHAINWDGKSFSVDVADLTLPAGSTRLPL